MSRSSFVAWRGFWFVFVVALGTSALPAAEPAEAWQKLAPFFRVPEEFKDDFGEYESPLKKPDGGEVANAEEWAVRRAQILKKWRTRLGDWPRLLEKPEVRILETEHRDNYTQHRLMVQVGPKPYPDAEPLESNGILMIPDGPGPFPAVLVTFYEPLSSAGLLKDMKGHHDYGRQLAQRGYVTLSIGTPGSRNFGRDTRPALVEIGQSYDCQPLGFLAYVAANCHTVLAQRPEVDRERIGIVGLSYGGKWSMFASCLYDKFACAVWSDPGIVFDETNPSINYWEPWYIGYDTKAGLTGSVTQRTPGVPTDENPRTGLYKELMEEKAQLVDLHALMAPRPVLVSGGTEDKPVRWKALNHLVRLNKLLGHEDRVGLTSRATHIPDAEATEQSCRFFDVFLKPQTTKTTQKSGASADISTAAMTTYVPKDENAIVPLKRERIVAAAGKGIALLERGATNYPKNRECFSCHHQTLPLLAARLARSIDTKKHPDALIPTDESLQTSIVDFTRRSFVEKRDKMKEGTGVGGKALTVGYGLWTFDLANSARDETIDAMITYLLKTQEKDGHWNFHSFRPPASSSVAMTTALAAYGLRAYGLDSPQSEEVKAALNKADEWNLDFSDWETHEDLIGALWGRYMSWEAAFVLKDGLYRTFDDQLLMLLFDSQRSDGGWAQETGMASDAYATGQALMLLAQMHEYARKRTPRQSSSFRSGIQYLIETQQPDGSWHVKTRAKPVQDYFDNGDPHGKDQFISMMATAWATAALATDAGKIQRPLAFGTAGRTRAEKAVDSKK